MNKSGISDSENLERSRKNTLDFRPEEDKYLYESVKYLII